MSACDWRRPHSLRRFAPCVLRWKTLVRFLSSAPCRVRIPALGKKKARYRIGNGLLRFCGAPFEQLLEPRSARSGRSFFLGYHALGLRHNRLVTVLVEVRHEVHAALVCREQKVLAVDLIAHDFLMHAIRQIVNRAIGRIL